MMCGFGVKRKQQRPNESFVEIFHGTKGSLLLMVVIAREIATRPAVALYRRSFPDAKLTEHRVENFFHINRANNFANCAQCFVEMNGSVFRRQSPGLCCGGPIAPFQGATQTIAMASIDREGALRL